MLQFCSFLLQKSLCYWPFKIDLFRVPPTHSLPLHHCIVHIDSHLLVISQRTLTKFMGVVALCYQHRCCKVLITGCHNSHIVGKHPTRSFHTWSRPPHNLIAIVTLHTTYQLARLLTTAFFWIFRWKKLLYYTQYLVNCLQNSICC